MPTRTSIAPFWTDDEYDQDRASDGISRYGVYLRHHAHLFAGDGPTDFAVAAWQVANGPIMSPGYVRRHPRILSVSAGWHEAGMLASVHLAIDQPDELSSVPGWRGWDVENDLYFEPYGEALAKMPAMLPMVTLLVVIPEKRLQAASSAPDGQPDVGGAKVAVKAIAAVLNERLAPVLGALGAPDRG